MCSTSAFANVDLPDLVAPEMPITKAIWRRLGDATAAVLALSSSASGAASGSASSARDGLHGTTWDGLDAWLVAVLDPVLFSSAP